MAGEITRIRDGISRFESSKIRKTLAGWHLERSLSERSSESHLEIALDPLARNHYEDKLTGGSSWRTNRESIA